MKRRLHIECERCGDQKVIKVSDIGPGEIAVHGIDMWCLRCTGRADFKLVEEAR